MSPRSNRIIARLASSTICCCALLVPCAPSVEAQGSPQPGQPATKTESNNSAATKAVDNKLQQIMERAKDTDGALFVDQDKVQVQAPMLTALIELHRDLSPYAVDAGGTRAVKLRDVLLQALAKNLELDISNNEM